MNPEIAMNEKRFELGRRQVDPRDREGWIECGPGQLPKADEVVMTRIVTAPLPAPFKAPIPGATETWCVRPLRWTGERWLTLEAGTEVYWDPTHWKAMPMSASTGE